jgi:hypothetical protein
MSVAEFQINPQFSSQYYFPSGEKVFVKAGTPVGRLYFPVGYDFSKKLGFRNQVRIVYDSWKQSPKSKKARVIQFVGSPEAMIAIAAQCSESNFDKNKYLTRKLLESLCQAIKNTPVPSTAAAPVVETVETVEKPVSKSKPKHFFGVQHQKVAKSIKYLGLLIVPGNKAGFWHLVNEKDYAYFGGNLEEIKSWLDAVDFLESFPELVCCPLACPVEFEVQAPVIKGISDIPEINETALTLHLLTIKQLKVVCVEYNLRGYSKLRKKELVEFVVANCDHASLVKVCSTLFGISI